MYCQNTDQTVHVLASENDGYWFNEKTGESIDLDDAYSVDAIKEIVYDQDEKIFYFMANSCRNKTGFYMTCFEE